MLLTPLHPQPVRRGYLDQPKQSESEVPGIGMPYNPYRLFTGIFVPEALVRWSRLSPGAKLCFGRLARYAGQNGDCHPSVTTLAFELGVRKRQVQTYLSELTREKLIRRVGERGKVNHYIFLWHKIFLNPVPMQNTAPVQDNARVPMQDTAPRRESSEESQDLDFDLDMRTSQKPRNARASVSLSEKPKSKPKQYPALRTLMAQYMSGRTVDPTIWPSDRQVLDVMAAAGGATEAEVKACLVRLHNERGLHPGTSTGPESWAWFATVVFEQFEKQRAREIKAREYHQPQ